LLVEQFLHRFAFASGFRGVIRRFDSVFDGCREVFTFRRIFAGDGCFRRGFGLECHCWLWLWLRRWRGCRFRLRRGFGKRFGLGLGIHRGVAIKFGRRSGGWLDRCESPLAGLFPIEVGIVGHH
jgi:hypothetical protein